MKLASAKPALTPKLRFPEFRDGPGWDEELMGEAYSFKGNNSLSRDKLNYDQGTVKNIHYGDIHTKFSALFDITKETVPYVNPSESLDGFRADNDCAEGDMVFADASEDLEDIGKSIELVRLNGERVFSGLHTILARPAPSKLALGFGSYLFKSKRVRVQIQKESQGAKVLGISATRLTKIKLPIPRTKAEQQKIAECLSTLDELIGAESQKLDALKTHKKGLVQQLFPREGETLPRLRFPEFQRAPEWEMKTLGEIVEVASGQVDPTEPPYCDMPHVGGENMESHTGNLLGIRTARELGLISGKYLFDARDVLYSKIRPALNKVALPDFEGICSADIYPIRPSNDKVIRQYLAYLLLSERFVEYAAKHSDRSKIPKVNRDSLLTYELVVPSPPEQHRIATCLSSLDALIAAQSDRLDALQTHKQGLLQQLFPSPVEADA